MCLYDFKLILRKLGGLVYDRIGDTYLTDIMQKSHHVYLILFCLGISCTLRYHSGILCYS